MVTCIAFTSDGTKIISGSWDNAIRIWDVQSGKIVYMDCSDKDWNTGEHVKTMGEGIVEIVAPNSSMSISTLVETLLDILRQSTFDIISSVPSANNIMIPKKGVKLSFMETFINKCGGKSAMEHYTTADVYERFVRSTTTRTKTSYCDCGDAELTDCVGNAQVYISHSWESVFLDVVDTLQYHFRYNPDVIIWFDVFSHNHNGTADIELDYYWGTTQFNHTVLVLSPWSNPIPGTASWYLLDIFCTAMSKCRLEIAVSPSDQRDFLEAVQKRAMQTIDLTLAMVKSWVHQSLETWTDVRWNSEEKMAVFNMIKSQISESLYNWIVAKLNEMTLGGGDHVRIQKSLRVIYMNRGSDERKSELLRHYQYQKRSQETSDDISPAFNLSNLQSISFSKLRQESFLPGGLMERLIGKAVQWSQLTNIVNVRNFARPFRDYAVLSYRRQQFRLICIPELNCIRLDIEGEHPLPLHNLLREQINECLKEFGSSTFKFSSPNLQAVEEAQFTDVPPTVASRSYGPWIIERYILSSYDVFMSHRWNEDDDKVVNQFYDAFHGRTVGSDKRAIQVSYDKASVKECKQFQKSFGKAFINRTIFVPILSTAALRTLVNHDPEEEDNLLIEWMLALECMRNRNNMRVRGIYPLIFGERNADGSVGDLFAEKVIDKLPDVIPTASIEVVRRLLRENGVTISSSLDTRTVRGVVTEISLYKGLEGWKYPNDLISKASEAIVELDCYLKTKHNELTHHPREAVNLLIEWMRASIPNHSKVRGIYKLMFGKRKDDGSIGSADERKSELLRHYQYQKESQ